MEDVRDEHYFHALAVRHHGDYHALRRLRSAYKSWREAWETVSPGKRDFEEAYARLVSHAVTLILREQDRFPSLLKEIPWPPFGLYMKGECMADAPRVAVVGTRKATNVGKQIAEEFAEAFSRAGLTVVSGLAFGIDAAAHRGALEGGGKTIAVLANGLDKVYPRSHEQLAREIVRSGGALVSEYPPGEPSYKQRFIERNRIISGMCRAVVVIEAPDGSGSLATARFALEQNREVFVVPGPARHPNYRGSHMLLKQGAALADDPRDVLEVFGIEEFSGISRDGEGRAYHLEGTERRVFEALRSSGRLVSADELQSMVGVEIAEVSRSLTKLVLAGMAEEAGGRYRISSCHIS